MLVFFSSPNCLHTISSFGGIKIHFVNFSKNKLKNSVLRWDDKKEKFAFHSSFILVAYRYSLCDSKSIFRENILFKTYEVKSAK